jgi:sulfate transport system substrate-binding protein
MHKKLQLLAATLILAAAASSCEPVERPSAEPPRQNIIVHGFSIEEEVFSEGIFPAFQSYWQKQTGQEVVFQSIFTGSEEITEAIIGGEHADVAILSNEQHAVWLHVNDLVETDWKTFPNEGVVSRSPLVIVVRPGNPLGIKDWADLARPGVRLVHCDPCTSGGAQWALLAEYGSALLAEENGNAEAAQEQLQGIWANVVATTASCKETLKEFLFGKGDALVTYEQDALLAQSRGADLEIVIPRSTIMSEHVAVIVDKNVTSWERKAIKAFVDFLWSDRAQEIFTSYYFRAVTDETLNKAVAEFHEIEQPFTVHDLGDWGQVYPDIINGIWREQISE